ncbi:Os04g0304900 [Oryza sativa Japonica Group]|uniref:Os04g0304900 protein n=1 Tax=Oryza sativa subsp. japonica TaxID=39947 RepID=A0A0P0W894_ORYSJ|nr:Os04g0304900 [Oryza sativa Japonica Group]
MSSARRRQPTPPLTAANCCDHHRPPPLHRYRGHHTSVSSASAPSCPSPPDSATSAPVIVRLYRRQFRPSWHRRCQKPPRQIRAGSGALVHCRQCLQTSAAIPPNNAARTHYPAAD